MQGISHALFVPNALALVSMILLNLVAVPGGGQDRPAQLSEFNALSCSTGATSLVLSNFAWNQAAVVAWQELYTYILLIVGILLLVAFAFFELKIAKNLLIPLRDMTGEAALALRVIAAGWGSFRIWVFYL